MEWNLIQALRIFVSRLIRSWPFLRALAAGRKHRSTGVLTVVDSRTDQKYTIPIVDNAIRAIDFKAIQANAEGKGYSGLKVFDPGFFNTACTESQITYIDGENGATYYRQHSIDQLCKENDFDEVAYLLIWGHFPSHLEKMSFRKGLALGMNPPANVREAIEALPADTHPSSMILAGLTAYTAYDSNYKEVREGEKNFLKDMEAVNEAIIRTISAAAGIIAFVYCRRNGTISAKADPNESFITNMLLMMGFTETLTKQSKEKITSCLGRLWILYLDHEMTNSTAAFLLAASTLTDPLSCMIASTPSAFGPLHGGAMNLAYKTFRQVGTPENVPQLIAKVKAKKMRLFGYGHRIYKNIDPRSKIMRAMLADELSEEVKKNKLLAVALEIDRVASQDEYFTSRNLKANADLYGIFVYEALGFDSEMIIPLSMISRAFGAMAHWREAMGQQPRLWRPQQIYVGGIPEARS